MSYNSILASAPLTSTNYHLKMIGTTIGNSLIWDNGTNVGIGNTNTSYTLDVSGTGRFSGANYLFTLNGGGTSRIAGTIGNTSGVLDWGLEGSAGGQLFTGAAAYSGNIGTSSATSFNLCTNSTVRATITSVGNVGIGTSSPNQKLEIWGTTRNYAGVGYYSDFAYNGTTYNFGSGETTDNVDFKIAGGATWTSGGNFRFWTQTGNTTPVERMRITSGGDVNINMPNSTDRSLSWYSANGIYQVAAIKAITDPSYNDAGILKFFTAGTSSSGMAERMRITSGGNVLVGTTSQINSCFVGIAADLSPYNAFVIKNTNSGNSGTFVLFSNSAGNTAGYIQHTGSTTISYVASSDYRLKENVNPIQNAIYRVLKIKPVTYTWKNTDNEQGEGFIAHELQEIVPLAVTGVKDAMNEDGTIKAQGIDYGKLTPLLIAAIQEMNTKLDEQNQTIQSLQEQINILAK